MTEVLEPMTRREAQDYAPQWGSMMTAGDPGAIMYSSIPPENAENRDRMISYIESELYPLALEGDNGPDDENEFEYNDSQMLRRLVAYLKGLEYATPEPEEINGVDLDTFMQHYVIAMLWATNDESDESGGVPMDDNYGPENLASEARKEIRDECRAFLQSVGHLITADNFKGKSGGHVENGGHDFFLTRCGHGVGFWDGDWKSDDLLGGEHGPLTKAAKEAGEVWPYVGDDGKIYHS